MKSLDFVAASAVQGMYRGDTIETLAETVELTLNKGLQVTRVVRPEPNQAAWDRFLQMRPDPEPPEE